MRCKVNVDVTRMFKNEKSVSDVKFVILIDNKFLLPFFGKFASLLAFSELIQIFCLTEKL